MNILVTGCLDDGGKTLLGNTHEGMGIGSRLHGIDSDTNASVSSCEKHKEPGTKWIQQLLTILEANREGNTRSELTVELGLGGTSTDGTPRDEVSNVLGGDSVEEL